MCLALSASSQTAGTSSLLLRLQHRSSAPRCVLATLLVVLSLLVAASSNATTATFNMASTDMAAPTIAMRAMTCDGKGTLTLADDVPRPTVSGRQLLVEVFASGLNRIDTYMMNGAFGRVPILGMEISGRVVARGPDCESHLAVGDAVIALVSDSGHAEFATVDERHAMPKPAHLSFAHAAAVPEQWLTAFQLLHVVCVCVVCVCVCVWVSERVCVYSSML